MTPKETLLARLAEIFTQDELYKFIQTQQFQCLVECANSGWPWMVHKTEFGVLRIVVEIPNL